MVEAIIAGDFESWRGKARELLQRGATPAEVAWREEPAAQGPLFAGAPSPPDARLTIPKSFLEIAALVACHRDPGRWALLYRAAYRLTQGEKNLLATGADEDTRALLGMEKAVREDAGKMQAQVSFQRVEDADGELRVAWYGPDHRVVERVAPFFARRLSSIRWALLTPDKCAYWDTQKLRFGPGIDRPQPPAAGQLAALWLAYYEDVFRHASMDVAAPPPERPSPRALIPPAATLPLLREAARRCEGCDLYRQATQVVFGEGPADARIVMVGEQPGDQEDLQGRPFVGPAGKLLDQALEEAGLRRSEVYITNAVKHFKFVRQGKRRLHQKPDSHEIQACRPWLGAEIAALRPDILVCLGATAAQSVLGRICRVTAERGRFEEHPWARHLTVTIHPSALLRIPEPDRQQEEYKLLVRDLKRVQAKLSELAASR